MDLSRVGACTLGLRMLDLGSALDVLAELQIVGVDLWEVSPYYENRGHIANTASAETRRRLKQLVADRGLRLDHLASYPGLAFNAVNELDRVGDLAWAKETIQLCADCAIPAMRIGAGRGESLDDLAIVAPLLRQASDHAAQRGVRLAMETHPGLPTCRADWIRAILDEVGSDNLGVLYDPGNLAPQDGYKDVPRLMGDRIYHVHLKNVHLAEDGRSAHGWARPTDGPTDMAWVLEALADCGYAGPMAIEFEAFHDNASADEAREGLKQWVEFLTAH